MTTTNRKPLNLGDLDRDFNLRTEPSVLAAVMRSFLNAISTPRLRSMKEFAEAELRVTSGPCPGPWRGHNQPYSLLWLELIASQKWNRFFSTGPSQTGKTLLCFVLPILYHLLEVGENVICLVPQFDMANDKWDDDIKPMVEKSRYKGLLPTSGPGSRGGKISASNPAINFKNGAQLKFMSGKGDDKKRAGKTSRVLMITETDGMDESSEASREADKITQAIRRTVSHGSRAVIYAECTLTIETGRTATEIANGTASRILVNCVHCAATVSPEREDLIGWKEAENVIDAMQNSHFVCSECAVPWNEDDRLAMNRGARIIHRGQTLTEDGQIVGDPAPTDTIGFRWNAFNNMFLTSGDIAAEEWRAARDPDRDNAERAMRQFTWALPVLDDSEVTVSLSQMGICARYTASPKGVVPEGTKYFTAAMDVGKRHGCHWVVTAFFEHASCQVVDYGIIDVDWKKLGLEAALFKAMQDFHIKCEAGWQMHGTTDRRAPDKVMIDSGYQGKKDATVVYEFMRSIGLTGRYWPTKGYGTDTELAAKYSQPQEVSGSVQLIRDNYHIAWLAEKTVWLVHINADYWKSWVHNRLDTPVGAPGAMTLFDAGKGGHLEFAKQLLAEQEERAFVKDKGYVEKWARKQRNNHFLDALSLTCVAGHLAGAKLGVISPTVYHGAPPAPTPEPASPVPFIRQVARPTESPGGGWIRRRS